MEDDVRQVEELPMQVHETDFRLVVHAVVRPVRQVEQPLWIIVPRMDGPLPAPRRRQRPLPVNARRVKPVALKRAHHQVAGTAVVEHHFFGTPVEHRVGDGKGQRLAVRIRRPVEMFPIGLAVLLGTVETPSISQERGELHRSFRILEADRGAFKKRGFFHVTHRLGMEYLVRRRPLGHGQDPRHQRMRHGHQSRTFTRHLGQYPRPRQAFAGLQPCHDRDLQVRQRPGERELALTIVRLDGHLTGHACICIRQALSIRFLHVHLPRSCL